MGSNLYLGHLQKGHSTRQTKTLDSLFDPTMASWKPLASLWVTSNQLGLACSCLGQSRPIQSARPTVTLGVTNELIKEIDGQPTALSVLCG